MKFSDVKKKALHTWKDGEFNSVDAHWLFLVRRKFKCWFICLFLSISSPYSPQFTTHKTKPQSCFRAWKRDFRYNLVQTPHFMFNCFYSNHHTPLIKYKMPSESIGVTQLIFLEHIFLMISFYNRYKTWKFWEVILGVRVKIEYSCLKCKY